MRASDKLQVKAEIPNAFFASVFTGKTFFLGIPGPWACGNEAVPTVQEEKEEIT